MTEASIYQRIESDSSIEISKNSKGFTYSVKAYGTTPEDIKLKVEKLIVAAKDVIQQIETVQG
jgi:tryptophan synthase alpha subunit